MKFLAFVLGIPLAWATVALALSGDLFAISILLAAIGPLVFYATIALLARSAPKPLPRKANPAKIARMERELGMEPSEAPTTVFTPAEQRAIDLADATRLNGNARRRFIAAYVHEHERVAHRPPAPIPGMENIARPTDGATFHGAPTWGHKIAKPPAERTTEDCPRPEGCVMAHPCRKCGADKGARCVGDPYGGVVAETAKQYLGIR